MAGGPRRLRPGFGLSGLAAAGVLLALVPGATAGSLKAPKPVVAVFAAGTQSVPLGGTHTTLSGRARNATLGCRISVVPALRGFPLHVRGAGAFRANVKIPAGAQVTYRFTVVADGRGGLSHPRTATVTRSAAPGGGGAPIGGGPGTGDAVFGSGGTSTSSLAACQSGNNSLFDASPLSAGDLSYVDPMGHMSGTHVLPDQADHIYFYMRDATQLNPVYAPGNVTLIGVVAVKHFDPADPSSAAYDYELDFSPCRDVLFWFQHISHVSDPIAAALAATPSPRCQTTSQGNEGTEDCYYPQLNLALSSGEQVGAAGGPGARVLAFDFGAVDSRAAEHVFVDPGIESGTMGQSFLRSVCPLDYYAASLRAALAAQLRNAHPGANGVPACGTTAQDKAGTLQGNWYKQGAYTPGAQGPFDFLDALAIVHSGNDPTQGELSAGGTLAGNDSGAQITFPAESSGVVDREPSQIAPGATVYCYQDSSGLNIHFDVQLVDAKTLQVDRQPGACPGTPTLTSPATYVR